MSQAAARHRFSIPHEHGAWITLIGATSAGALAAPRALPAIAVGTALIAGFLARGPIEQHAVGRPAAHDRAALIALALLGLAPLSAIGLHRPAVALLAAGCALGIVGAGLIARRTRHHRDARFELIGMGTLGLCAAPIALAGGAGLRTAWFAGVILAAHAAVAVPLVRTQIRPRERQERDRADRLALVLLAAGGLSAVAILGTPLALLPLAPRALHLAWRRVAPPRPVHPNLVGVRESVALAATVALLLFVA